LFRLRQKKEIEGEGSGVRNDDDNEFERRGASGQKEGAKMRVVQDERGRRTLVQRPGWGTGGEFERGGGVRSSKEEAIGARAGRRRVAEAVYEQRLVERKAEIIEKRKREEEEKRKRTELRCSCERR
jgi:hypothetical protein